MLIRRVTIGANNLVPESSVENKPQYEQLDLFTDYEALTANREKKKRNYKRNAKYKKL